MTSRFFQGSDSSSESDEEELYSEGEEAQPSVEGSDDSDSDEEESEDDDSSGSSSDDEAGGASRFLRGAESDESESDEDKVTVVRSAKDKRFEEAEAVMRIIENAVKINDWAVITSEFDKLLRLVPALVTILDGRNPKNFVKMLSEIEETANETYEKQKVTAKVCVARDGVRNTKC
jgi:translation initiation factor 3 subunit C